MTAPVWLVSGGREASANRQFVQHAVVDGRARCGRPTAGWAGPRPGRRRCWQCVVATSPDMVTYQDLVAVGLTYRQVQYWTTQGYLQATVPPRGSGSTTTYPVSEVRIAAAMAFLVAAGLPPAVAERVARTGFLTDGVRVVVDTDPVGEMVGVAS